MTAQAKITSTPHGQNSTIRNLPVNLFASVMGIAGLSIAWGQAYQAFGIGQLVSNITGILALAVFAMLAAGYIVKVVRHPEAVAAEYGHPIAGNFFGTIPISILLLSTVIDALNESAGHVVWAVGVVATFALCFSIVGRMLKGKVSVENAVPAWFIPGVATLDIAVAGGAIPSPWVYEVNLFAISVGTMIALLFFTMIMARIIHHEPIAHGMIPSLIILMAPFEVGFLAYTNFTHRIDAFSGLLFYFGLFVFLALAPRIFRSGVPFTTGWWSVGFPMAALASSALKYSMFVHIWPLKAVAAVLLALVTVAVVVLFFKTLQFFVTGKLLGR